MKRFFFPMGCPSKTRLSLVFVAVLVTPLDWGAPSKVHAQEPEKTNRISQYGITWSFEDETRFGRFANGDYWALGPVNVVSINPKSTRVEDRYINGSMVNPPGGAKTGGFDSAFKYDHSLNVAYGVDKSAPLRLEPGASLVSSISNPKYSNEDDFLTDVAILTVVGKPPLDGQFRPPYAGNDKSVIHTMDELDLQLLKERSVQAAGQPPPWREIEDQLHRPFMDFGGGWFRRSIHAGYGVHSPTYGRETSQHGGAISLALLRVAPMDDKLRSLVLFVQRGIDLFGIVSDAVRHGRGNPFHANGGHHSGRKWNIIFAGIMLKGDERLRTIGKSVTDFAEDGQTSYVSAERIAVTETSFSADRADRIPRDNPEDWAIFQADYPKLAAIAGTGRWQPDHRGVRFQPYTGLLGMPEWHGSPDVTQGNASWTTIYRHVVDQTWHGQALAALIMDARDEWNHDAYFDYVHRTMSIEVDGIDPFRSELGYDKVSIYGERASGLPSWNRYWYGAADISSFVNAMWRKYWTKYYRMSDKDALRRGAQKAVDGAADEILPAGSAEAVADPRHERTEQSTPQGPRIGGGGCGCRSRDSSFAAELWLFGMAAIGLRRTKRL